MMRLQLLLPGASEAAGSSSEARVAPATACELRAAWGDFVALRLRSTQRACVFRIVVDATQPSRSIRIEHWPHGDNNSDEDALEPTDGVEVDVQCLTPVAVRSVQYVELVPAGEDQPRLAAAFVKSMLRGRVLNPLDGRLTLQLDGLDYGIWRYRAFCRGQPTETETDVDAGVVGDSSMVLVFPSASGRLSGDEMDELHSLQPIGAHAHKFRELVAMTLGADGAHPSRQSKASHAPRSLMLQAPSGAGKSTLVLQVARELRANVLVLDSSLLAVPQLRVEDFFAAAVRVQPSLLVIDDLELLFPRVLDEVKYKAICKLVRCFEEINDASSARVVVVGTVSEVDALHVRVRQVFAEEVSLGAPDRQWMLGILSSMLPNHVPLSNEFLTSLVTRYGQRPSNMASIARAIRMRYTDGEAALTDHMLAQMEADVSEMARSISTASTSSVLVGSSVPNVSWSDIGGLEKVKQSITEMVIWPLEKPNVFRRMGITPPLGIILHGPPGTGKTMLAKAAASASRCNFLSLSASDLMRAEFGESEKAIGRAFETARALSPCLMFIDEFQSLFGNRNTGGATTSRMISQLLVELDALKAIADDAEAHATGENATMPSRIFVLAATNQLSAIDPAFLQPGRFENIVYVGLPNAHERREILKVQRAKMPWHSDVSLDRLVEATERANAASLVALCQAAAIQAMQRESSANDAALDKVIVMQDFEDAISKGNFDFGQEDPTEEAA